MKRVVLFIAILCTVIISCKNDADYSANQTTSFLVADEGDSMYYRFITGDSNTITHLTMYSKEFYVEFNLDMAKYYCLDSDIYCVNQGNNILYQYINGNRKAGILASIVKNNNSISGSIDTTMVGVYPAILEEKIINRRNYMLYCDIRTINGVKDSSCFRIYYNTDFEFNTSGFKKVMPEIFSSNCSFISVENKIDVYDYLKDSLDIQGSKYILIDFFTYYCLPCIKSIPELNGINELGNINVIGIHPFLEKKQRLKKFKKTFECTYSLYGENALFYYDDNEIRSYPHYILFDTDSYSIVHTWNGYSENLNKSVIEAIARYENR